MVTKPYATSPSLASFHWHPPLSSGKSLLVLMVLFCHQENTKIKHLMNRECKFLYLPEKCVFNKEDLVNKREVFSFKLTFQTNKKNIGFLLFMKFMCVIRDSESSASVFVAIFLMLTECFRKSLCRYLR